MTHNETPQQSIINSASYAETVAEQPKPRPASRVPRRLRIEALPDRIVPQVLWSDICERPNF